MKVLMPDVGIWIVLAGIVYMLCMLTFLILLIINFALSFMEVRRYIRYGIIAVIALVVSEVLFVTLRPDIFNKLPLPFIIGADSVASLRLFVFTALGIYYCRILGRPAFPLLIKRLPDLPRAPVLEPLWPESPLAPPSIEPVPPAAQVDLSASVVVEPAEVPASPAGPSPEAQAGGPPLTAAPPVTPREPAPAAPAQPVVSFASALFVAIAVAACACFYSAALFLAVPTRLSALMQKLSGVERIQKGLGSEFTFYGLVGVLAFALGEEVIFRLGIQNYLANGLKHVRCGYLVAVLITAAIWTLGHAGMTDPQWVKLVQVFPLGLTLGWLAGRYGIEACMLAHSIFNVVMLAVSSALISA